ncbi:nucleotidyl transferase AbiEii/AbiGii toxin family protein [Aquimarina rubra]|uniref:Nucleotidyl transferase AbiEii/AbiGii toxin family protein n=1 Tax=Aquimarina rubra TaxID=1920033 RepID=A0ABW5LA91_9FLAO
MSNEEFDDFHLGGGTNLAIKYNHRLSIDIDLFSTDIVGTEKLNQIINFFKREFETETIQTIPMNFGNEQFAWLQVFVNHPDIKTKVDIIQNLKLTEKIESIDDIRLINDIDIGALKLLAASNRGVQKDFYDLYLLSEIYPLVEFYDRLQYRNEVFASKKDKNIFDISTGKPIERLERDLTSLGNFNRASNKKEESNRIVFTEDSSVKLAWPVLRDRWKKKVQELAKEKGLIFNETPTTRSNSKRKLR